jgi:isoleucyl-tRNA synthetase
MLDENEGVDWVPESAQKRFHNFVSDSPDWCISRQNYWGIPIPIWVNDETGEKIVIGSFEELEEKVGKLPEDFDAHKHVVDDITWEGENGGKFRRIPDIFDVWFDSGIAPFASLHYPFEEQPFEDMWPMDFITEASDQIRGWFYSLMFTGILGFDEAPYEKVLFQGYVLRPDGEKMSKSAGTTIDPQEQVEKYGADLLRFYQLRLAPAWEQKNYDEEEIKNEIYRLFSVYWNTKEFYNTYAEDDLERPEELEVEDEWILSRINSINKGAADSMDDCMFHEFTRELERFILEDLSRWYVKKVRKRLKKGDKAAAWTLGEVLRKSNMLMAPFAPFITESIYEDIGGEKVSVHIEDYPEAEDEIVDEDLENYMELAREIVEKSGKIRDENQYNLRWPANRLVISTDEETQKGLRELEDLVKDMANVRTIEFGEVASELVAEPDYSSLGPKFGGSADEVAQIIEELEHDQIVKLRDVGEIEVDGFDVTLDDVEVRSQTSEDIGGKSFEEGEIYLDLNFTEDIKEEAFANEVIRAIQQKRKDAELEVEDKVDLAFDGDFEALKNFKERIAERVNVASIVFEEKDLEFSGELEFKGLDIGFSFSKPVEQ